jgi:hypothetical protein
MRRIRKGDPSARASYDREDREYVTLYGERRSVTLYGEAVGMSAEELLIHARAKIREHKELIDLLLRHVPRKFERKVDALDAPCSAAEEAIAAVEILIANAAVQFQASRERG